MARSNRKPACLLPARAATEGHTFQELPLLLDPSLPVVTILGITGQLPAVDQSLVRKDNQSSLHQMGHTGAEARVLKAAEHFPLRSVLGKRPGGILFVGVTSRIFLWEQINVELLILSSAAY